MSLSKANYSLLQCIFIIINLGLNIYDPKFTAKIIYSFHKIYHCMKHNTALILFHQVQNTVKLTFYLQSHTTTTTALLTQVSIRAACFC